MEEVQPRWRRKFAIRDEESMVHPGLSWAYLYGYLYGKSRAANAVEEDSSAGGTLCPMEVLVNLSNVTSPRCTGEACRVYRKGIGTQIHTVPQFVGGRSG